MSTPSAAITTWAKHAVARSVYQRQLCVSTSARPRDERQSVKHTHDTSGVTNFSMDEIVAASEDAGTKHCCISTTSSGQSTIPSRANVSAHSSSSDPTFLGALHSWPITSCCARRTHASTHARRKLTVAAGHESAVAQGQQSPTCRGTVVVAHGGANDGGANDWFNDVLTESFVPALTRTTGNVVRRDGNERQ